MVDETLQGWIDKGHHIPDRMDEVVRPPAKFVRIVQAVGNHPGRRGRRPIVRRKGFMVADGRTDPGDLCGGERVGLQDAAGPTGALFGMGFLLAADVVQEPGALGHQQVPVGLVSPQTIVSAFDQGQHPGIQGHLFYVTHPMAKIIVQAGGHLLVQPDHDGIGLVKPQGIRDLDPVIVVKIHQGIAGRYPAGDFSDFQVDCVQRQNP